MASPDQFDNSNSVDFGLEFRRIQRGIAAGHGPPGTEGNEVNKDCCQSLCLGREAMADGASLPSFSSVQTWTVVIF